MKDVLKELERRRDVARAGGGAARIEAQGSAFGFASPFCSSSIEMPSGLFTKAMKPSRGGRLMVTPLSIRRWQVA